MAGETIYLGALLSSINERLGTLEGSDLSGVESKLSAIQTDIATVKADIAKVKKYTSYLGAEAPTDL